MQSYQPISQQNQLASNAFFPKQSGAHTRKHFVKVVVIGDSNVGKTSLIQMFEHNRFSESFKPTIGADFSNKEIDTEDGPVILQIWDTAGQERFQSLSSAFYRGADCCILVYDVTNQQSFFHLDNWKQIFLTKSQPQSPEQFPFLVIGNKIDLADHRMVPSVDGKHYAELNGMGFIEASAKENKNVKDAFCQLGRLGMQRQVVLNPQDASAQRKNNTTLDKNKSKLQQPKKMQCCSA